MTKHSRRARVVRAIGIALGLAAIAFAFAATLTIATRPAAADVCRSQTFCTWRYGQQVCTTTRMCTPPPPPPPPCRYVTRCFPQESCHSWYGTTTCVTRNVCREERLCY